MKNAFCPACGVPVVPGYVRCPKCHAALPAVRIHKTTVNPGGTAMTAPAKFPWLPIVLAVIVGGGVIAYFGLSGGKKTARANQPAVPAVAGGTTATPTAPTSGTTASPTETATPSGPTAREVAADLERSLKRQRLWSTVDVIGERADVRSALCTDPGMASALDGSSAALKAAGLTKLRCLEQSGRVVVDRDL